MNIYKCLYTHTHNQTHTHTYTHTYTHTHTGACAAHGAVAGWDDHCVGCRG